MSELIECDCCKKQAYFDISVLTQFCEVKVTFKGTTVRWHLCEDCYKNKFLKDILNIEE